MAASDVEYVCAACGAAAGVADLAYVPGCRACTPPAVPPAAPSPARRRGRKAAAVAADPDATPITDVGAPPASAAAASAMAPAPAAASKPTARTPGRARAAALESAAPEGDMVSALAASAGAQPARPARGKQSARHAAGEVEVEPDPSDYAPAVAPTAPRGAPVASRAEWLAAADAREGWLERLDPAEPEAAAVLERFVRSAGTAILRRGSGKGARAAVPPVVAIYRARNPAAELLHEQCRARLTREAGAAEAKALTLYHGTDRAAAGAIVRGGFDASRSGAHGELLGRGIYLSSTASYSMSYATPDAVGGRAMLVCSALVGVVGRHSASSGNIYCVLREMQALPLYVIWT